MNYWSVTENNSETIQNATPSKPLVADDVHIDQNAQKENVPGRFPELSTDEIDRIANNTVKLKTRKQTIWGIKVFKGNYC